MNAVILQSLGAAETVTGSKHLLKTPELNILIDCGLFQGIKSLREKNWEKLPVHPSAIDAVILTHAHLDHCGYIPLLVKQGFKGKIYMTEPTRDLTELILLDSAKIQEEDAEKANRQRYSKHKPALPLYTAKEAEVSFRYFITKPCNTYIRLNDHVQFHLKPCGHILGACSVEIDCYGKRIVFSGDIGRYQSAILSSPEYFTSADYVVMESTYGDKLHEKDETYSALADMINQTVELGGNILIPSFAVGRAQELMYILNLLRMQERIPRNIPIILDSPMAASATEILLRYPEFSKIHKDKLIEMSDQVIINRDYRNTDRLIWQKGSKIILAASGMLSGGRVLEYLKHYIGDSMNAILMIGFQAEGTRGRALLNKAYELKIHGKYYSIHARVMEIMSLSAHADQAELLDWIRKFHNVPGQIMLVHGEPSAQESLRVKLQYEFHVPVKIMRQNQDVILFLCEDYIEKVQTDNIISNR